MANGYNHNMSSETQKCNVNDYDFVLSNASNHSTNSDKYDFYGSDDDDKISLDMNRIMSFYKKERRTKRGGVVGGTGGGTSNDSSTGLEELLKSKGNIVTDDDDERSHATQTSQRSQTSQHSLTSQRSQTSQRSTSSRMSTGEKSSSSPVIHPRCRKKMMVPNNHHQKLKLHRQQHQQRHVIRTNSKSKLRIAEKRQAQQRYQQRKMQQEQQHQQREQEQQQQPEQQQQEQQRKQREFQQQERLRLFKQQEKQRLLQKQEKQRRHSNHHQQLMREQPRPSHLTRHQTYHHPQQSLLAPPPPPPQHYNSYSSNLYGRMNVDDNYSRGRRSSSFSPHAPAMDRSEPTRSSTFSGEDYARYHDDDDDDNYTHYSTGLRNNFRRPQQHHHHPNHSRDGMMRRPKQHQYPGQRRQAYAYHNRHNREYDEMDDAATVASGASSVSAATMGSYYSAPYFPQGSRNSASSSVFAPSSGSVNMNVRSHSRRNNNTFHQYERFGDYHDQYHNSNDYGRWERKMVEIMPGVKVPMHGSAETEHALAQKRIQRVSCSQCNKRVLCVMEATLVICPECRGISPTNLIDSPIYEGGSLGLGLDADETEGYMM